jgi:lipopolysaccharide export system permease protein
MPIVGGTLVRYFGLRFLSAVLLVFVGIFLLVGLLDYIELMRRSSDIPNVSALLVAKTSLYRVPQVTERVLPFCVLIGAMSCYLNLSRRLELVIARAAGISAWQFIAPAVLVAFLLGVFATTVYNPLAAVLDEQSKRYEAELFGHSRVGMVSSGGPFWASQKTAEGQAIINAKSSRDQGVALAGVTVFTFWSPASGGCWMPASTASARCRSTSRSTGSRLACRPSKSGKVLRPRKLCRFGNFHCISISQNMQAWSLQAIGCNSRSF